MLTTGRFSLGVFARISALMLKSAFNYQAKPILVYSRLHLKKIEARPRYIESEPLINLIIPTN